MSSPECTSASIPVINDTPGEALPTPGASMERSGALVDAGILPVVLRLAPIPLAGPVGPGPGDDDDDDDEDGGGNGGNIDPDDDEGYDDEDDDDDDEEPLRCAPSPR